MRSFLLAALFVFAVISARAQPFTHGELAWPDSLKPFAGAPSSDFNSKTGSGVPDEFGNGGLVTNDAIVSWATNFGVFPTNTYGWWFFSSNAITATELGVYQIGVNTNLTAYLIDDTNFHILASVNLSTVNGSYTYAPISVPLSANHAYSAVVSWNGSKCAGIHIPEDVTVATNIFAGGASLGLGSMGNDVTNQSRNAGGSFYGPVNFRFHY